MVNAAGGQGPIKTPPQLMRTNLCNISCRWSPFDGTKLAVAQAQHFGLVGNGAVSVLNVDPATGISLVRQMETPDTCFDVCFNESNQN